jgi:hypothetical protein
MVDADVMKVGGGIEQLTRGTFELEIVKRTVMFAERAKFNNVRLVRDAYVILRKSHRTR